jgi:predicted TIM-barrel fold metal-dependent hydrolase
MTIDVHGHIAHPDLLKKYPMPPSLADVDGMIESKLAAGIELTIVGSPTGAATMAPVPGMSPYDQPLDGLRAFHDWLAGVVDEHRAHLRAYAWCNAFGDERSLAEVAKTVRDGGFVGVIANTSVRGEYLDSPRADDFFDMIAELDVPILLHPGADPAASQGVRDYGMVEMVGRSCDVTMGLAAIVLSGRLEKHPRLRIVAGSSGGALGLLGRRLDFAWQPRHWAGGRPGAGGAPTGLHAAPRTQTRPSELMRRIYVDTTADGRWPLAINEEAFGPGQLLFGTDSPPVPVDYQQKIDEVRAMPLDEAQTSAILRDTAVDLFGLRELAEGRR